MRYFLDTEFEENGETIMPISLGLWSQDNRGLYIEFEFDDARAESNVFVKGHVLPHLKNKGRMPVADARDAILAFVDEEPQFWAYYADYDWVLFCQIFGRMIDLPSHFPRFCMDLQQLWVNMGRDPEKPPPPINEHNALADAQWNAAFYDAIVKYE